MNSPFRRRPTARTSDAASGEIPERGQSLVEFGLVFPMFVTLVMGLIEFAFVFNALLAVNYAARDAALAAAEAGDALGADCVILSAVESAIAPPASESRIQSVNIYEARPNGQPMVGRLTVYNRTGSTTCTFVDGTTVTLPYTLAGNTYPMANRCNILGGCPDGSTTVDNIGVQIFYEHDWVTPLTNFVGGGAGGLDFDRSSVMRMEPIL